MKFICTLCNYIHEENIAGDVANALPKDIYAYANLPEDWQCPGCGNRPEFYQSCSCVSLAEIEGEKAKQEAA